MLSYLLSPKGLLILVLAVACLGLTVLMAWSELNFQGTFPAWINWLMQPLGVSKMFDSLRPIGDQIGAFLTDRGAGGEKVQGTYAWALFMFGAMCASAIAIILIGREEAEEKTVLPVKK